MFNPASKVFNVRNELLNVYLSGLYHLYLGKVIEKGHYVRQVYIGWYRHFLLFQKRRASTDTTYVPYNCWTALFKHVVEQVDSLIL